MLGTSQKKRDFSPSSASIVPFLFRLSRDGADDFVEQSSARCLRHVFVAALHQSFRDTFPFRERVAVTIPSRPPASSRNSVVSRADCTSDNPREKPTVRLNGKSPAIFARTLLIQ